MSQQQAEVETAPPQFTLLKDVEHQPVAACKNTNETKPEDNSVVDVSKLQLKPINIILVDTSTETATTDLLKKYLQVNAKNPTNICNQALHTIYSTRGDQALYGTSTSTLLSVQNRQIMTWDNSSSSTTKYTESYTIGFTASTSTEVSVSIKLAPSFKDVSIGSAEAGYKVITTEETQSSTTKTIEVTIPPQSSVYFYQRRYNFSTDVYFTLDAWGELSIAGSNGGYHIQRATISSHIDATDYLTTSEALSGTTTSEFPTQTHSKWFGDHVRKFENLTQRAKDTLIGIGIDGSQQD